MNDDSQSKWDKLPNINVDRKHIKRRLKKAEGATIRHTHKFVIKRWSNIIEVQRHVVMWILAIGILIGATGFQLMWNQQSYRTTTAAAVDSTYAEAVLGPVDTLNPLYASSSAEQSAAYLMFSSILKYDKSGRLGYDLASQVSIDKSNTKYTVAIRPNAKWQDGYKLTAKDVNFTVNLLKDPDTRAVVGGDGWSGIDTRVIDDNTIQFVLSTPYAGFEHALTFPVLPEHILGRVSPASLRENSFSKSPIGSGPFRLSLIQNADDKKSVIRVVNMTRNDNYYRGKVEALHFQLHVYDSTDAIVKALSQSEVNAAIGLSSVDLNHIDPKKYTIITQPIQSGVFALINTRSGELSDVTIRRALQLATDTQAIRDRLTKGTLALDNPIIPNLLSGNIPNAPSFNLNSAKALLESKGWKLNSKNIRTKGGKELKISVVTQKNSELERVLEVLSGQWRALGVSIETKTFDPNDVSLGAVRSILQPRNFDVLLYQLNIGGDPDVYAYWHSSQASQTGLNFSNYSDPVSDDALLSARLRLESRLRSAKYLTFVKEWLKDVPAIGLYQSTINYVYSGRTHTFNSTNVLVSPTDRYADVLDWSVGNRVVYKTP